MRKLRRLLQRFGCLIALPLSLAAFHADPVLARPALMPEARNESSLPADAEAALEQGGAEAKEKAPGLLGRLKNRIIQTWNEGDLNLLVPFYTWHNRLTYDCDRWGRYNENPWGGGAGLSVFDEDGDSHILYLMVFQDSWNRIEPFGGYAYFKNWHFGQDDDFRAGVGFTLGITAREQYDYIPFPLPLPVFGIGYKQLSVEAAYIPGGYNDGNVLFAWVRFVFD